MIEGVTSDFFEAIFSCSDMPPGGKVAKRPARAGTLCAKHRLGFRASRKRQGAGLKAAGLRQLVGTLARPNTYTVHIRNFTARSLFSCDRCEPPLLSVFCACSGGCD